MKGELIQKIEKLPIFQEKEITVNGAVAKRWKAICEEGNNEPVAVVTKKYILLQLKDSFKTVLDRFPEDIEGDVYYYYGRAGMTIFPRDKNIGLYVVNSVDRTTALRTDFIVKDLNFIIPRKVAVGLRKVHRGETGEKLLGDFLDVITKVQETWEGIVAKLQTVPVEKTDIENLKEIVGKRLAKKLEEKIVPEDTKWEAIVKTIKLVSEKKYKSNYHKMEKLRKIGQEIVAQVFMAYLQNP